MRIFHLGSLFLHVCITNVTPSLYICSIYLKNMLTSLCYYSQILGASSWRRIISPVLLQSCLCHFWIEILELVCKSCSPFFLFPELPAWSKRGFFITVGARGKETFAGVSWSSFNDIESLFFFLFPLLYSPVHLTYMLTFLSWNKDCRQCLSPFHKEMIPFTIFSAIPYLFSLYFFLQFKLAVFYFSIVKVRSTFIPG